MGLFFNPAQCLSVILISLLFMNSTEGVIESDDLRHYDFLYMEVLMKQICSLLLLMFLFTVPSYPDEKMRVAVLDLKAVGVSQNMAKTISGMLRTDLVNMGRFTVVERTQMDEILKEQGFQQTGCTDQECAVLLGRLMSANKMLIGEVSSLGKSIIMNIRIVDVEKGISEYAARDQSPSVEKLDSTISRIAKKLTARMGGTVRIVEVEKYEPVEMAPAGFYLRSIVPGWGQYYAGKSTKAYIYGGAFLFTVALTLYTVNGYNSAKSDYEDLPEGTSRSTFSDKRDAYESAALYANISIGLLAAVYIANWVDVLYFTRPEYGKTVGFRDHGNRFFTLDVFDCSREKLSERRVRAGLGMRF